MSNSENLKLLVRSLSKAEKRYFKLNAIRNGQRGTGQYLKLFSAIDKGVELEKRPGENRSVTNSYLYGSILQCLDAFHENNSINSRIDRMIRNATVLHNRGLNSQALTLFLKVESIAWKQQEFVRLQSIYWYIRNLLAMNVRSSKNYLTMEQMLERNHYTAKQIELMSRLRFLQYRFQKTVAKSGAVTSEKLKELGDLLNSDVMNEITDDCGFYPQLTASHIRSQYYLLTNNSQAGFEQGRKVFDLCFSHRELLQERGRLMIASANNYMMRCQRAREFDEMKRVLLILENESPKDVSVEMIRLETYYSNLLSYYILTKQFDKENLLTELSSVLDNNAGRMNQAFLMYIYSFASQYAFFRNNYREAIRWINLFLNHENRTTFLKNLSVAYDYRLLIYYEQGKMDLLESLLNVKDPMPDESNEFPMLRDAIRQFLKQELKHGESHIQNLEAFQLALKTVGKLETEKEGIEFFPFSEWVIKKIHSL